MPSDSCRPLPVFQYAGRYSGTGYVGFHSHPGTELILVNRGSCTTAVQDRLFKGGVGTLLVIAAGVPHDQRAHGLAQTRFVSFAGLTSAQFDESPRAIMLDEMVYPWALACFEQIVTLVETIPRAGTGPAQGLVHALVALVKGLESETTAPARQHPALTKAVSLIDRSPGERFTVAGLAAQACVSESYLTALFRTQLETSPIQYLMTARMQLAQRLMGNPYLSIKEIGYRCGFEDPGYFSRQFKNATGAAPGAFRKKNEIRK